MKKKKEIGIIQWKEKKAKGQFITEVSTIVEDIELMH